MKEIIAVIAISAFVINTTPSYAEQRFKYPKIIECTTTRAVGVKLIEGIVEEKEMIGLVNHSFEYIQNGEYKYNSNNSAFSSRVSNQGEVLNLYKGATSFSMILFDGGARYIGAWSHEAVILPDGKVIGGHASGKLFEGHCELTWD